MANGATRYGLAFGQMAGLLAMEKPRMSRLTGCCSLKLQMTLENKMEIDRDDYRGDEADRAELYIESVIDDHVKEAMRQAADMPIGEAGECDGCGDYFQRLVDGLCGRCRDKFVKYYAKGF